MEQARRPPDPDTMPSPPDPDTVEPLSEPLSFPATNPDMVLSFPEDEAGPEETWFGTWYGWQVVLADGLAYLLMLVGATTEQGALVAAGGITYLFGAAAVHFGHDNSMAGGLSIGMRLTPPFLGLGVAVATRGDGLRAGANVLAVGILVAHPGGLVAPGVGAETCARQHRRCSDANHDSIMERARPRGSLLNATLLRTVTLAQAMALTPSGPLIEAPPNSAGEQGLFHEARVSLCCSRVRSPVQ